MQKVEEIRNFKGKTVATVHFDSRSGRYYIYDFLGKNLGYFANIAAEVFASIRAVCDALLLHVAGGCIKSHHRIGAKPGSVVLVDDGRTRKDVA